MSLQGRNVVMMLSIFAAILALFMPWYEVSSGFLSVGISGWDMEGSGVLLVVLLVVGGSWIYEVLKSDEAEAPGAWSLVWVGVGLWNAFDLISLWNRPSEVSRQVGALGATVSHSWGLALYSIATLVFVSAAIHAAAEWWKERNRPKYESSTVISDAPKWVFREAPLSNPGQTQAVHSLPRAPHQAGSATGELFTRTKAPGMSKPSGAKENAISISNWISGATALIDPNNGFNLFSLCIPKNGQNIELLWSETEFGLISGKPTRSGIPILFPFAGRISNSTFRWTTGKWQKSYNITSAGKNDEHAIHGFVAHRPWRVIERGRNRATAIFQGSIDAPETLQEWPSDYTIRVTWVIEEFGVTAYIAVTNPGTTDLPFTFGLHPYFRVPLGEGQREDTIVTVPADAYLPLDNLLPIGQLEPVDESRDLREGKRFEDIQLDDVLTGLIPTSSDRITTSISNPSAGLKLLQHFSTDNNYVVVFTPPHREAISIEPYSGAPDPFRLMQSAVDPSLAILKPGSTWNTTYSIRLVVS